MNAKDAVLTVNIVTDGPIVPAVRQAAGDAGKEAVALALDIVSRAKFTGGPDEFEVLATALQQLIDQRDERAEAAEAKCKYLDERLYARVLECDELEKGQLRIQERAEAAEAKLAELVRRVRAWAADTHDDIVDDIEQIIAECEAGPLATETRYPGTDREERWVRVRP